MRSPLLHYDHWPDIQFDFQWNFDFVSEFFDSVVGYLQRFGSFLLRGLRNGLAIFKVIWEKVFKRGLLKLLELYGKLRGFLARVLGPLLRWLRKIREWLDKHYWPMVKRQLAMLHQLRQILSIFRAFNFKWAKALDQRLALTEQKLIHNTRVIYAKINELITLVNLASDPLQLLIANAKTRGLLNALNDFIVGVTGQTLNAWLGGPLFNLGGGRTTPAIANIKRDAMAAATGEDNWLSAAGRRARNTYDSLS